MAFAVVLVRFKVPWKTFPLLFAAAISDEEILYSATHSVSTWNFRGDADEFLWILLWLSWQIVLLVKIVPLPTSDREQFAA
jgi:hypothetical protein